MQSIAAVPAASGLRSALLGKYREIVLAVGCFLLFDLGVLVLNFYTSYQISEDALSINLAGRQRMLSQRMAKAALALDAEVKSGADGRASATELRAAVALFDSTLLAFTSGGKATGADGKAVVLNAVESSEGQRVLAEALDMWQPYKEILLAVAASPNALMAERAAAVAKNENARLLKLMNDLTVQLEVYASDKAARLRMVQTIGILLALANFMFILFKFLRKLRESDAKADNAQRETGEILGTVQEGLFLIDRNFRLGSQFSASLPKLLGRAVAERDDFSVMLQEILKPEDHRMALDYATLLMGDRVKEALVRDLNPLREVAVQGVEGVRHLSFEFNRVVIDGVLSHLLVTVTDVTDVVALRAELDAQSGQAEKQLSLLLQLVQMQPATLLGFLTETETVLLDINDRLRAIGSRPASYRRLIDHLFRQVHGVKGNAAALGLDFMAVDCESFETALSALRGRDQLAGEELIGVSVHLQAMFERVGWLRKIVSQFAANPAPTEPDAVAIEQSLGSLTQRVADDHKKSVTADISLLSLAELSPEAASAVRLIATQLVRNAVVHGIESPKERTAVGKASTGSLQVELKEESPSRFALRVRDDGRGLCTGRIREALLKSGRYTEAAVAQLSERQIVMEIFKPGFTTASQVDAHAGRGVGLDAVAESVRKIGGHLKLFTLPGKYTEFRVEFAG